MDILYGILGKKVMITAWKRKKREIKGEINNKFNEENKEKEVKLVRK